MSAESEIINSEAGIEELKDLIKCDAEIPQNIGEKITPCNSD
jgi:hypothetical protein